jgi:hypothetical protein
MNKKQPQPVEKETGRDLYQPGRGPTSIEGVEARDFPDKGRGTPETSPGKEMGRKTPDRTGAGPGTGTDVGMAGTPDVADVRDHGHRKHN